jgi:ribonuclease D
MEYNIYNVETLADIELLRVALEDVRIVGLDCETNPSNEEKKVSIMQVGLHSSVFLIDLLNMKEKGRKTLSDVLMKMLTDSDVVKVGQGLDHDLSTLHLSYPSMPCFSCVVSSVLELKIMYRVLNPMATKYSLQYLSMSVLGVHLSKMHQRSNWDLRPLSLPQRKYAAHDVIILIQLHDALWERILHLQKDFDYESLLRCFVANMPSLILYCKLCVNKAIFVSEDSLFLHSLSVHALQPDNEDLDMNAIYREAILLSRDEESEMPLSKKPKLS